MPRFDVYANPDKQESKLIPYYLDVQSDHIKGIDTRIVIPLWNASRFSERTENLHPEFDIGGQPVVMDTPALGAVPRAVFRQPVANLASHQMPIQDALDALFGAY
jgi:toxin CcdB